MLYCHNLLEDANLYTLLTWNVNRVRNIMIKTDLQIYSSNGCTNSNYILNFKVSKMERVMPTKVNWLTQLASCCHCLWRLYWIHSVIILGLWYRTISAKCQQPVWNEQHCGRALAKPVSEGNCKVSDLQVTRFTLKWGKFSFFPWDNESKTKCE